MGITPQQFEQMQKRMLSSESESTIAAARNQVHTVLLGVDPSVRGTGYGIIRIQNYVPVLLDSGTIKCPPTLEHSRCFLRIFQTLHDAIAKHQPTVCVVEGLFYVHNLKTAIVMGEARGVCLAAAAEFGLAIYEMAPRRVKQAIVGYGGAQKLAVAKMIQRMLHLDEVPEPDAADALALALTYMQEAGKPTFNPLKKI